MENKKKVGIILIIIIVMAIIAISTVYIYRYTNDDYKDLSQQMNNENIEISQQTKEDDNSLVIKKDEVEENLIEDSIQILTLNNSKNEIRLKVYKGKVIEDNENLYEVEYDVQINGKKVTGIENGAGGEVEFKNYQLEKIKDTENSEEYIILKVYKHYLAGGPGTDLYIIDKNANIIGKLKNSGLTSYMVGIVKDEEGKIINYEETGGIDMLANEDYIIDYIDIVSGIEKHRYTINNGVFTDKIEKTYNNDEVERAGK